LRLKVLKDGDVVRFDPKDYKAPTPGQSYGTAEFSFCPTWYRGKLKCVYIYHLQQRDVEFYYRIDLPKRTDFRVTNWRGVSEPRIWIFFHCKDHKCMGMRAYVPRDSNQFVVQMNAVYFERGEA